MTTPPQGYVGRVPIFNYGTVSVDSPSLQPGGEAIIDTIEIGVEYGSGSNPWAGVDRIDGTRFVRLYPAGTAMKGRIGTINPSTGVISYGSEQSLSNMTAAANAAPTFQMLSTTLGVMYYETPTGGLGHDFHAQGFSVDANFGTISDSSASTLVSNGFSQFQGSDLVGMMSPYTSDAFFGIYRVSSTFGRNLYLNAMTSVFNKDSMTRESDQVLVAAAVDGQAAQIVWLDADRAKGLVAYGDYTDNTKIRVRPFSNAGGIITVQGVSYTEISTTTNYYRWGLASFPDQGVVFLERDPASAVQIKVHFIDYNTSTYAIAQNTTVTLDGPVGLEFYSGFSAQNIDANNILIVATGTDGTDDFLSAWIAGCQDGVYSMSGRTDVTTGAVADGASAGEMTIAQLDNDWYDIQLKYVGVGSNWKIHLTRVADTRYAWQRGLDWYVANTGPRVARTTTTGNWTSSAANQTITATSFTGTVTVAHHGVTFIDCEFVQNVYADYTQYYYPTFSYCLMNRNGQTNTTDVPALPDGTVDHCNIYRTNKGLQVRGSMTITDSWLHDAVPYASTSSGNHRESIITNGQSVGSVVSVLRCWIDPIDPTDVLSTGEGLSGTIQLFNDFAECSHWTVDGNYLGCGAGTGDGSFTTRWGYKLNNGTDPHHIVVTNNYIWPSQFGVQDGWKRDATNVWTNNTNANTLAAISEPATHLMF